MPELPEVEALATFLTTHVVGRHIDRVDVGSFQVLKTFDPPASALVGATITGASRRGKFLDICDDWPAPRRPPCSCRLVAMAGRACGGADPARGRVRSPCG